MRENRPSGGGLGAIFAINWSLRLILWIRLLKWQIKSVMYVSEWFKKIAMVSVFLLSIALSSWVCELDCK